MTTPPSSKDSAASVIGNLALMYFRHNDPARALVLSISALQIGPAEPRLVLLVAACFLRTDDAEQALAALSRFDGDASLLSQPPSEAEQAAARLLHAKALFRSGAHDAARERLHAVRGPMHGHAA